MVKCEQKWQRMDPLLRLNSTNAYILTLCLGCLGVHTFSQVLLDVFALAMFESDLSLPKYY